jgi:predicted Zn-dependent protease
VQAYVRDGKTDEAIVFLDELLAENPGNLQALGIRGNLHMAAGELDAAEARYRAILAADPGNGGAHSALARLASLRGDDAGAEAQIRAGLEAAPDNILLLARLAQMHERAGRFGDAIEVYERLYTQLPDSLVIANNLASLLSDHRGDDPAAVTRAYAIAGRLERSDQPHYRDTFGWTRYLKGEYETALERIEPVAEALPGNPWVRYHLGMIYAALNRAGDARDALEAALTLAGDRPFPPAVEIRAALDGLAGQ